MLIIVISTFALLNCAINDVTPTRNQYVMMSLAFAIEIIAETFGVLCSIYLDKKGKVK